MIVGEIATAAEYGALVDVARSLAGLLASLQLRASASEAGSWEEEQRQVRARLNLIQPGTPEVTAALRQWAGRLTELHLDRP